jgi:ATP-binding cassette subfamily B protein
MTGILYNGWRRRLSEAFKVYSEVIRRTRLHLPALLLAAAGVLVTSVAEVLKPWPLKVVIDNVLRNAPLRTSLLPAMSRPAMLAAACLALVAIYLVVGILGVANNFMTTRIGQRMIGDLRAELFDHLQRLSLSFHRRREIGDLMVRISNDTFAIQTIVMSGLFPAASSAVLLIAMFAVMVRIDATLAWLSLIVVPPLFMTIALLSRRIHRIADAQFAKESRLFTVAQSVLSSIHLVQAFAAEPQSQREFVRSSTESLNQSLRLSFVEATYAGAVNVLIAIGTAAVIYLGARHAIDGRLTIGDLIVFTVYLASLYGPVNQIFQTYGQVRVSQAAMARCLALLALEPEIKDRPDARAIRQVRGRIEFDDVSFGYGTSELLLREISFKARPGERVAIVGPSGAGKTTLTALMARFYDPLHGAIRIDGADLREMTLQSLRRNIAIVMQPPVVIGGTLRMNLELGQPNASPAQLERVVQMARLGPVLANFRSGFDELIGPGGHSLSEGEAQRVTIARALLKDAPILILDEPTSALDIETEREVLEAIDEAMRDRTTIVIAHRLSTIRGADRIIVLRGGTIEETGTFDELRARDGFFNHLYRVQTWGNAEPARRLG